MSGAEIAAHVAAERRRRMQRQEEQEMTKYQREELDGEWEFKIVRSNTGAFRKPEALARLVQEERMAGWEMLEKFDNQRVRFKRPVSARRNDGMLPKGYDPYRAYYGSRMASGVVLLAVLVTLIAGAVVFLITLNENTGDPSPLIVIGLILFIGMVFAFVGVLGRR